MQSNLCKKNKDLQIFQKLKLFNNLRIIQILVLLNIMMSDIDMNNKNSKYMNLLQLKWMLFNQTQKSNYKSILNVIIQLIIKTYICL